MPAPLSSYIAGEWQAAESTGPPLPSLNPSDPSDVVALVPASTARVVDAAARAAETAFESWRGVTGTERATVLHRWAQAIDARAGELADAMTREIGKPIVEARGEVSRAGVILRYYAGEAVREAGEVIPAQARDALQFTRRVPRGVVGLITPWNFPLAIPLWKAAPALAFGNTVVLKPSELSAQMAHLLSETARAADMPPGVFNVIHGGGSTGAALVRHEAVQAVSFTGSAATGAEVSAAASARNIPYQTEMGGKNVSIVLADADLGRAASLTAAGAMRFAGQKCTATSRVVVEAPIRDAFLDALRREIEAMLLGPVTDPNALVGPLISERAKRSAREAIECSKGRRVCGGSSPAAADLMKGYFLTPALIADVDADAPEAQDELFAPVLVTHTAHDLDEAISLANRTRYGLSASLFTRNLARALLYIDRIDVGLVRVNGDTTGVDPHAPFGGMKGSSSGTREQGRSAREFYTGIKTIQIHP
jgi:aldehyde dehydrogenase (NAD+)